MNETLITPISSLSIASGKMERPCLVQIYGPSLGRKFLLEGNETVIGRDEACTIVLELDTVSRRHCRLLARDGGMTVADAGSTNGTFLNGLQIGAETPLRTGDLIKAGDAIFKFLAVGEQGSIEAQYHEEIYRLTIMDGLTQLYNKRYATDFLERELARASRHQRALALVLFDIDHFKDINDARGHSAGDGVLRELAGILKRRIRREECLARWGGEEFALVLPEADEDRAGLVAEALRKLVAEHRFGTGEALQVTFSAGWPPFAPSTAPSEAWSTRPTGRSTKPSGAEETRSSPRAPESAGCSAAAAGEKERGPPAKAAPVQALS